MTDVIEQLRGYGEQLETVLEPATGAPAPRRVQRRRTGPIAALVGAAGVLATIGGIAVFLGGGGPTIPSVAAEDIPSFRATVAYPSFGEGLSSGTVEVLYEASTGRLSMLVVDEEPGTLDGSFNSGLGSFLVYDGEQVTIGLAEDEFAYVISDPEPELAGLHEFAWPTRWERLCADGEPIGAAVIAGRAVAGVECRDSRNVWEVWVDGETGVVLRVDGPVEPRVDGLFGNAVGFEVIAIDYDVSFEPSVFDIELSEGQQSALEYARSRNEAIAALPALRARITREFAGEVALEFGGSPWSDERVIWYQPGVGLREEMVANTRTDDPGDSPGSFSVWTLDHFGEYQKTTNSWYAYEAESDISEAVEISLQLSPPEEQLKTQCDPLPAGEHLGRTVRRYENCSVSGTDETYDVWIDVGTGLVVLREGFGEHYEVIELEVGPDFPRDTFVFTPPEGAEEAASDADPWRGLTFGPGEQVPVFVGNFEDGSPLDLADLRGKPVLLYLWGSFCPPNACDVGQAQRIHDLYGDRVMVIAFASQDQVSSARQAMKALAELDVPFGLCDPTCQPDDPGPLWRIGGYPFWVLIDAEGNAVQVFLGGGEDRFIEVLAVIEETLP